jgi:hypothetical protein
MLRDLPPATGKRLLFWDEKVDGGLGKVLDFLGVVPGGRKYGQPQDRVRSDVGRTDRQELARALQLRSLLNPTGGDVLMGYMGAADCRICGVKLGTRDFFGHGFVWPERAEHYVLVHNVWTDECAEMLAMVRRSGRRSL